MDSTKPRRCCEVQTNPMPIPIAFRHPHPHPASSRMSLRLPQGYRAAGVYSRRQAQRAKLDLSLVVSDRPAVGAGVYTKNLVCAAPVKLDRERTPSESIRVVAINSGVRQRLHRRPGRRRRAADGGLGGRGVRRAAGAGAGDVDRRHRLDAADGKDSCRHPGRGRASWATMSGRSKTPPAES